MKRLRALLAAWDYTSAVRGQRLASQRLEASGWHHTEDRCALCGVLKRWEQKEKDAMARFDAAMQ